MYIIAGRFKKHKLVSPKNLDTRPTLGKVREMVFNICQNEIEGATFLDLFAGFGAMGLEALSRGAKFVTFIESNKEAQKAIEENIKRLGCQKEALLIKKDVFKTLEMLPSFDLIFADPPYGKGFSNRVAELVELYALLNEGGSLFLEDMNQEPLELKTMVLQSDRNIGRAQLRHLRLISSCDRQKSSQ